MSSRVTSHCTSQGTRNCLFRRSIDVGSNQVTSYVLSADRPFRPLETKQRLIIGSLRLYFFVCSFHLYWTFFSYFFFFTNVTEVKRQGKWKQKRKLQIGYTNTTSSVAKKRGIIFSLKVKQCKFYHITCLEKATNNSHDTNFFPMILI
jgi:diphthamide synthase subunit DPH2